MTFSYAQKQWLQTNEIYEIKSHLVRPCLYEREKENIRTQIEFITLNDTFFKVHLPNTRKHQL